MCGRFVALCAERPLGKSFCGMLQSDYRWKGHLVYITTGFWAFCHRKPYIRHERHYWNLNCRQLESRFLTVLGNQFCEVWQHINFLVITGKIIKFEAINSAGDERSNETSHCHDRTCLLNFIFITSRSLGEGRLAVTIGDLFRKKTCSVED